MNAKIFLYVANWKMYFTHEQAIAWVKEHENELGLLAHQHTLVLCPSFIALQGMARELEKKSILVGAQECSAQTTGAYTGQIDAASLQQVGCRYCIIGHSEQRAITNDYDVTQKACRLLENAITPIICISEVTPEQLDPVVHVRNIFATQEIIIAYEPLWAIGSGTAATQDHVRDVFRTIKNFLGSSQNYKLLYGGSVNATNCAQFKHIELLDGFLIGKASTDFASLHSIISD